MNQALRRARQGALLLGLVFVFAIVGHNATTGRPLLESFYWTVITIAGVGYSQEVSSTTGPMLQLLSIVVILVGMLSVAYTLGMLIQAIIEGQLEQVLGDRRMKKEIDRLQGHTIICGFGRIGQHLSHRLAEHGVPFVVIDPCKEAMTEALGHDYRFIHGDATEEEILEAAGIQRAETIVFALQSDADNVFLTLTARNMKPDLKIIARGEHLNTEKKLIQAGADQVVLPAVIGAERMSDIIAKPNSSDLLRCIGHETGLNADIDEFVLSEKDWLVGHSVGDEQVHRRLQLLIVAIRRAEGETLFNPDNDIEFRAGDTVIAMGPEADLKNFRRNYEPEEVLCS